MDDQKRQTRKRSARKPPAEISDRAILQALVGAAVEQPGPLPESLNWRWLQFDPDALERALLRLTGPTSAVSKRRLAAFAHDFSDRNRLRVSLIDDLEVALAGGHTRLPRWMVGEALGALGSNLLPTRNRVRRAASESAREVAYFGYGTLGDQLMAHPVALVRAALAGEQAIYAGPVLLDEAGPGLGRVWSLFDLLKTDPYFEREVVSEAELARFQQRLREEPLDGNAVTRLREFFSRRATVGLRDTTRWALGSRHPWFGWQRARELIDESFERWGTENFLCPRLNVFTWDVALDDQQLAVRLQANQRVAEVFASQLGSRLADPIRLKLGDQALITLAHAALDCHHDHPDFDLEARGRQGGETTARFVGHALYVLAANAAGRQRQARHNSNLMAHFQEKGVERQLLAELAPEELAAFYSALAELLRSYSEQGGVGDGTGLKRVYERLPMVLYAFYESPVPHPKEHETVVDSFSLAALREPLHAAHLREHPEVFEKLVVFFSLVLRHYLDTDHAPDLRPEKLVRDFMLLGLWGTNSPNLVVNLYRNEQTGKVRSELRFIGRSQVKAYRPESDRKHEAALARLLASQLGPLLEPSVLRAVGAFLMAAEEHHRGSRVQDVGALALIKHSLELFREAARTGIKGSLVDLATLLEMLVDNSVDLAQRSLARMAGPSD